MIRPRKLLLAMKKRRKALPICSSRVHLLSKFKLQNSNFKSQKSKFKHWSTTQLASSAKLLNLPTALLGCNDLHWLPVSSRIQRKITLIRFHIIAGTAPPFLSELLHLYSPYRCLPSGSDTLIFRIPRTGTLGERSFQYIGPFI